MKRNILLTGLLLALTESSFGEKTAQEPKKKTPTKIVVKDILDFNDVPLLFLGRDEKENGYLCVLEGERYICALTKELDLAEGSAGVIDLRMVFEQSEQWYSLTEDSITPIDKNESLLSDSGYFINELNEIGAKENISVPMSPKFIPEKRRKFQRGRKR